MRTDLSDCRPKKSQTILISANAAWNIAHFRLGLIKGLLSAGFSIICVSPVDVHVGRLKEVGCQFEPLPMDNMGSSPAKDLHLVFSYLKLFRKHRPNLFLGFTIKPNIYGSLAANIFGVPVVNNVTGLGTAFIRKTFLTRIVTILYRLALRGSRVVFFQNPDDEALMRGLGIVRSEQTSILPGSGIDLTSFVPEPLLDRGEAARFLLAARLISDKGVREFVEAARLVKHDYPEAQFHLLGPLDVENRTAISKAEVEGWVRAGIVEYLGATDDVRPFISDADCVVLPSYREGIPRTLLEAAAMGRPLIATDVPGCREPVQDGANGFLCRVKSAEDLAGAIRQFLELDQHGRGAMGRLSREIVEKHFDERNVLEAYLKAVQAALPS